MREGERERERKRDREREREREKEREGERGRERECVRESREVAMDIIQLNENDILQEVVFDNDQLQKSQATFFTS